MTTTDDDEAPLKRGLVAFGLGPRIRVRAGPVVRGTMVVDICRKRGVPETTFQPVALRCRAAGYRGHPLGSDRWPASPHRKKHDRIVRRWFCWGIANRLWYRHSAQRSAVALGYRDTNPRAGSRHSWWDRHRQRNQQTSIKVPTEHHRHLAWRTLHRRSNRSTTLVHPARRPAIESPARPPADDQQCGIHAERVPRYSRPASGGARDICSESSLRCRHDRAGSARDVPPPLAAGHDGDRDRHRQLAARSGSGW
jgi:hypothetical protein